MPRYNWTKADLRRIRRRRAAGEPLRTIALDYGDPAPAHTTISRALKIDEDAEAKALAQKEARRLDRERARRLRENGPPAHDRPEDHEMTAPDQLADDTGPRGRQGGRIVGLTRATGHVAVLDRNDSRRPPTRADLYKPVDHQAEEAVDKGGGMQAVLEATGLHALKNVVNLIDPAILERARQNDAAAPSAPADDSPPG